MEKRSLEKDQCSKSNNLWQITYYFDLKSFPQISVRAFISVHGRDTCGNSGKRESADWGCSIELKAANSKQDLEIQRQLESSEVEKAIWDNILQELKTLVE